MTLDVWLAKHPYLEPIARLDAEVERAIAEISLVAPCIPSWDRYSEDFLAGVPLLNSQAVAIDLSPLENALPELVERLKSGSLPEMLRKEAAGLPADLNLPQSSGFMRYLSWRSLSRFLHPVICSFSAWRQEERWLRHYCPVCGSAPAMAQLLGTEPGRLRLLACGCCRDRWRYRRTGCPFCRTEDDHRLAAVAIEGQGGLRIDYCEECHAYLKTYEGRGSESVFLADWTSIQLDVIALNRGLKRVAGSIYEL
jgi:FdhE protein